MSKAGSDDITGPDVPGESHDSERCERLAGLAVGPGAPPLRAGDSRIGRADVLLMLAHLSHWGIPAQAAAPGLAYDVIAEPGEAFGRLRIRVRAATKPRRRSRFALHRGRPARRVRFDARPGDFDLAAFVAPRLGRARFQAPPVNDADADDAGLRGWFAALSALQAGRRTPPGGGGAGAPPCLPV